MRHFDTNHLWIQETVARRRAKCEKAMGTSNLADLMIKDVNLADLENHIELIGACYPEGRADGASEMATDEVDTERPRKDNVEFKCERAKVVDRQG